MSRQHLTDIILTFFTSFSQIHTEDAESSSSSERKELEAVLSRRLAYTAYIGFYHLLGGIHLESVVGNIELVRGLAAQHQATLTAPPIRPHCFR
jgi:hypothetical protein